MSEEAPGLGKITIERRFHGPRDSGNGGYVCGRLAAFIEGTSRVRLYVPPPLEVPMKVLQTAEGVVLEHEGTKIAEAWPARLDLEVPEPPDIREAAESAKRFRGFRSHRFPTCFVCGRDRAPDEGLQIFAGPLPGSEVLACTWTPRPDLAGPDGTVSPEFVWCVLDCPGGFAFPEPEDGTILLGELTVEGNAPARVGEPYIVTAWEVSRQGRKHRTGTALFTAGGDQVAAGLGVWLEVGRGLVE